MLSFRRPGALSFAILIHACVILALLRNGYTAAEAGREQVISLLPMEASAVWIAPPRLPIRLARPDAATIDAPKIAIEESTPANDAVSNAKTHDMHLPPRLDPQAPNAAPELTADLRNRLGSGQAYIVIVRALVLESGKVGNAEIAASSGSTHWRSPSARPLAFPARNIERQGRARLAESRGAFQARVTSQVTRLLRRATFRATRKYSNTQGRRDEWSPTP